MKKVFLPILLCLAACSAGHKGAVAHLDHPGSASINGKLYALAFQQTASEYRALCLQAFNLARSRVEEALAGNRNDSPAIISDIDETILDNSPYDVQQALQGKDYDAPTWYRWTAKGMADTIPGAVSFLKYAASKGVAVFYLTNREEQERRGTLKNLQKFGFPNADTGHLLLKQGTSSKEGRRQRVMAGHHVILLLGDNLGDFSSLFDQKNLAERRQNVDVLAADFGNRFIVLPNPVYGDWEGALYRYRYDLSPAQKDSAIRASLQATGNH